MVYRTTYVFHQSSWGRPLEWNSWAELSDMYSIYWWVNCWHLYLSTNNNQIYQQEWKDLRQLVPMLCSGKLIYERSKLGNYASPPPFCPVENKLSLKQVIAQGHHVEKVFIYTKAREDYKVCEYPCSYISWIKLSPSICKMCSWDTCSQQTLKGQNL